MSKTHARFLRKPPIRGLPGDKVAVLALLKSISLIHDIPIDIHRWADLLDRGLSRAHRLVFRSRCEGHLLKVQEGKKGNRLFFNPLGRVFV